MERLLCTEKLSKVYIYIFFFYSKTTIADFLGRTKDCVFFLYFVCMCVWMNFDSQEHPGIIFFSFLVINNNFGTSGISRTNWNWEMNKFVHKNGALVSLVSNRGVDGHPWDQLKLVTKMIIKMMTATVRQTTIRINFCKKKKHLHFNSIRFFFF